MTWKPYKRIDPALKLMPKCQVCEIILSNTKYYNTTSVEDPTLCQECYDHENNYDDGQGRKYDILDDELE